jgi:hypothetical protein
MRFVDIHDINFNSEIVLTITNKEDFLTLAGEGRVDDEGNELEIYVFRLDERNLKLIADKERPYLARVEPPKNNTAEYYAFAENVTYIYKGEW